MSSKNVRLDWARISKLIITNFLNSNCYGELVDHHFCSHGIQREVVPPYIGTPITTWIVAFGGEMKKMCLPQPCLTLHQTR